MIGAVTFKFPIQLSAENDLQKMHIISDFTLAL